MAHAIVYSELGAPSVLHSIEIPEPVAGPGEVVVRIERAGVNPLDAKRRSGLRPMPPITEPRRLGLDGAGVVTAVGDGVTEYSVGDRVAVFSVTDTYSSAIIAKPTSLALLDDAVSFAQAAGIGIPAGTAYQVLRSLEIGADDVLLVHGASGAVGQALIQFAVAEGTTVIGTASERRHAHLRSLGAIPVTYGDGLEERVRAVAPGPITVAVDCIGTDEAIEVSKALVANHDRVATIVRGPDAAELGIRAFSGGSPIPLTAQEEQWRLDAVPLAIALAAKGKYVVDISHDLPMSEAAEAHRLVETASAGGKIVLRPEF